MAARLHLRLRPATIKKLVRIGSYAQNLQRHAAPPVPAQGDVMASLHILKGPNQGEDITLTADKTTLGRDPECDIVIPASPVSRFHAQLLRVRGRFFIEDTQSRNKTFLNNQQVEARHPLKPGDKIRICDFIAEFSDGPKLPPIPPDMAKPVDEPDDPEGSGSTTVEATLGQGANLSLETQPADKLKLLLEISSALSKTLELDRLLPQIVDSLFGVYKQADRCFLILAEEVQGRGGEGTVRLFPKVIKTRRVADESTARFSKTIVRRCLDTGDAFLSDDASRGLPLSQSVVDFRIRSVLCAPLVGGDGKAFGVIQLDTQDRNKKFTQDDLRLLRGVADQAAVALENAKLHASVVLRERFNRDMQIAHQVQLSFLPLNLPEVPGYEFFAYYESAQEVGGDYYGFIPVGANRLAVLVGDVAGKGVPAALLMAKLSSDARYCLLTEPEPATAIMKLNELMYQYTSQMDRFVTLAAAFLDQDLHSVMLVNAGHLTPLVYRGRERSLVNAMPTDAAGLPLGIIANQNYQACPVALGPGDSLLLFSDGVCDAVNAANIRFDTKGIHAALTQEPAVSAREAGERLLKAVKQYAGGRAAPDDITLVCLGRTIT
jgi:sigma-B regulation protein RsbU (phosphoserine phosphatase)